MHGGPSQMDLFDYKPQLKERHGQELPASVRGRSASDRHDLGPEVFPGRVAAVQVLAAWRPSGTWVSELLPHLGAGRRRTLLRPLDAHRGDQPRPGRHLPADRASTGRAAEHGEPGSATAWAARAKTCRRSWCCSRAAAPPDRTIRSMRDCGAPAFCRRTIRASVSVPTAIRCCISPTRPASTAPRAAAMLDALGALNRKQADLVGDPEIQHAHRPVRNGVSHADFRPRTDRLERTRREQTLDAVRPMSLVRRARLRPTACWPGGWPNGACASCSSYHRGWDQHCNLPSDLRLQCSDVDQPAAALIRDLKQRGLLDETLVIWGGEFGRTIYSQGKLERDQLRPRPSPALLYHVAGRRRDPARHGSRRDRRFLLQHRPRPGPRSRPERHHAALLGLDHTRLTYRFQGRDFRLTDVHGRVVSEILR